MRRINASFLSILRIELEDLQADIEALVERCASERVRPSLTNYVALENAALYRNELLGLADFGRVLDATDADDFATLDEMIEDLRVRFRTRIRAYGLAELTAIYVDRKLEKVRRYVTQPQEPLPRQARLSLHERDAAVAAGGAPGGRGAR